MKVTIFALGSRGDVQPFVALGRGFKDAGYDVCIATHRIFSDFVYEYGLEFSPVVPENPVKLLGDKLGQEFSSGNKLKSFIGGYKFFSSFKHILGDMMDDCLKAAAGSDFIINSLVSPGHQVAEKMAVPCFLVGLWPANPTKIYPHPLAPFKLGKIYNKWTHHMVEFLMWAVFKDPIDRWRKKHSLPYLDLKTGIFGYVRKNDYPWLFGFSHHILPRPNDWNENIHVAGYLYLNESRQWSPPADLEDFINAGPPPLYFGFGSMIYKDKERITSVLIAALEITGQRAVLSSGWSGLGNDEMPGFIHRIDSVPHSWLFPKMAAVIHHGGSGTTSASLRAGVPALIVPFLADQFFWGNCIYRLGAGPKPLPKRRLTAVNLAEKINIMISNPAMKKKVTEISQKLSKEDGVGRAVGIIGDYFNKRNNNS